MRVVFFVETSKSSASILGSHIRLRFIICQHARDEELMKRLVYYFNCGGYNITKRGEVYYYVYKFTDIYEKIIPFFRQYPIVGIKALDFQDWCKVAEIIKTRVI